MKEHGMMFSPAMITALLAGTKTQTRRLKPRQIEPGDRLWAKEALCSSVGSESTLAVYEVDREWVLVGSRHEYEPLVWRWKSPRLPALFMPKCAARLWLEVTAVRTEPLCSISFTDALSEGMVIDDQWWISPNQMYAVLWNSLHPDVPFTNNPPVQVITFKQQEVPGG